MPELTPLMCVKDLDIRFAGSSSSAVRGISFTVGRGEIVALVGESGSGKSATALALTGLLPGDAQVGGEARFDGTPLLPGNAAQRNAFRGRRVGMVFQDPAAALDPVFTIGWQLDETLRRHHPALDRKGRRDRAISLLEAVGIPEPADRLRRFPNQMSGGQLQRVVIALALAGEPDLLIADEPTTALDVTVQQGLLDLLWRLNRDRGMAILLITHDMGVVADLAQRVLVMRHGVIVETGDVREIFQAPRAAYTRALLAALPGRAGSATAQADISAPVLTVDGLRIAYSSGFGRRNEVVHGVSFDIHAGEFVGLVGESGSGKSTIGSCLLGLIASTAGRITFDGKDLGRRAPGDVAALRPQIGAVFQNPMGSLNPRLTIAESIAEPLRTHRRLDALALRRKVDRLIGNVQLPKGWRDRLPAELSGGQRQRVAIARALALDPLLLIADEPTSALDVSVQAEILDLLRQLQQETRFACLFISHDLAVVRQLCQRVVVLRAGVVVEADRTSRVLDAPQEPYTRNLVASAPLPDPQRQAEKRAVRLGLRREVFA
ncbi:dipeptide ABC transporter ATP-binding protein [Paenirhodobacter populi]|uniref:dipeptide ABC transporter ATP-binding protein n=1 Tax=Paenirhodobacter populi TaxID=2306993 RepID=UPI000FE42EE7|nr:ABC transporter ATP-binding protein [Sinirhodobacter populi]RWR05239.1 ABC transporter ATP-binding protein [Sinirhodobacter populi]